MRNIIFPRIKRTTIASVIFSVFISLFSIGAAASEPVCKTYNELYDEIIADVGEWQTQATYYTNFEPKRIDLETIKEEMAEDDYILAQCLYGFTLEYTRASQGTYKVNVVFKYYMSKAECEKIEKICERMAEKLEGKSDYEKIKYVHDYIILNCEYSIISNGPYSCLKKGKACCNGYALAFQMMMDSCGIECEYVANNSHAWNTVCLDGVWYNIDTTWDDGGKDIVLYTYFLKSNADFPDHQGAKATALRSYDVDDPSSNNHNSFLFRAYFFLSEHWAVLLIAVLIVVAGVAEVVVWQKKNEKKPEDDSSIY